MKKQILASLILVSLSASVFALPQDTAPAVAEGGSDRLIENRVAEGGADRLIENRVAEGGSDRLIENRVAEGGADRTGVNRIS